MFANAFRARNIHTSFPRRLIAFVIQEQTASLGAFIILLMSTLAILAPIVAPYSPTEINYLSILQPPSFDHWLGTDDLGRDILSRLLYGTRYSLSVGVFAVLIAVVIGVPIGLVSGYLGGLIDEFIMRIMDSVIALPPLVLALTISATMGPGLVNATIAIAVVSIPTYARLIRGQVLSLKNEDFILAARSVGVPSRLIVFRHTLPNVISPIIVQASLGVGFAIILESSLSFIGLGVQPPTSTWGSMVKTSFQYLELAPWFVMAPSIAIFVAVLSVNMLGEGLRNRMSLSSKRRL